MCYISSISCVVLGSVLLTLFDLNANGLDMCQDEKVLVPQLERAQTMQVTFTPAQAAGLATSEGRS